MKRIPSSQLLRAVLPAALLLLAGCAHGSSGPQPSADVADAPIAPTSPDEGCGLGGRSQLTAEEHMRRFGCPPCPCACVGGELRCAPCARCVPRTGPEVDGLDADAPADR